MLSKTIQDATNEQIKNELYSAYQYLSMSAYCESVNLPGFAHWMRVQFREETVHALKFYDFIQNRGGHVVLQAIDQPVHEFDSPLEVFEQALAQEQKVPPQGGLPLETGYRKTKSSETQLPIRWILGN